MPVSGLTVLIFSVKACLSRSLHRAQEREETKRDLERALCQHFFHKILSLIH